MVELVWKSMYYEESVDPSGKKMTDFEKEGDELEWNHKSELGKARIKAKRLAELIKKPLEPQDFQELLDSEK